jgi:hypothetical protein
MIGTRVLATALLLSVPTIAHAQCAWVLWSKAGGAVHDSADWDAEDAFDSRDKCVVKITQIKQQFDSDQLSTWYALGKKVQLSDARVSYRMTSDGVWNHVRCLPASVDPHRRKAGSR